MAIYRNPALLLLSWIEYSSYWSRRKDTDQLAVIDECLRSPFVYPKRYVDTSVLEVSCVARSLVAQLPATNPCIAKGKIFRLCHMQDEDPHCLMFSYPTMSGYMLEGWPCFLCCCALPSSTALLYTFPAVNYHGHSRLKLECKAT